jgi:hypothetical protein
LNALANMGKRAPLSRSVASAVPPSATRKRLRVLVVHETLGMGHTRNALLIVDALRARPDVEVLLEVGSELFDTADATLAIRAWNTLVRWDMLRTADVMVNWFGRMFVLPVSEAIATPMLLRRLAELDVDILVGTSDLWNRALGTHARRMGLPFFILPCEMNVYLDQMHPAAIHLCMFEGTAGAIRSFDVEAAYFAAPLEHQSSAWERIVYVLRFWLDHLLRRSPILARADLDHPARNDARCEVIGPVASRVNFERTSRLDARRALGLDADKHVVLVISGSLGGPLVEGAALELVHSLGNEFHVIAICGKSVETYERLSREHPLPGRASLDLHGFTKRLPEFLAAADVFVARPSAGTFVEGLLARTPMVVIGHITSNDAGQAALLEANDIGRICTNLRALPGIVESIMARHSTIKENLEAYVGGISVRSFDEQVQLLRERITGTADS